MQYGIVVTKGTNLEDTLARHKSLVEQGIEKGWTPQGGLSIAATPRTGSQQEVLMLGQAMIKLDPDDLQPVEVNNP